MRDRILSLNEEGMSCRERLRPPLTRKESRLPEERLDIFSRALLTLNDTDRVTGTNRRGEGKDMNPQLSKIELRWDKDFLKKVVSR